MQAIVARRTQWLFDRGSVELARRITSAANVWADVGARPELGGVDEVRRQAEAMGFGFVQLAVPQQWRSTHSLRVSEPYWV